MFAATKHFGSSCKSSYYARLCCIWNDIDVKRCWCTVHINNYHDKNKHIHNLYIDIYKIINIYISLYIYINMFIYICVCVCKCNAWKILVQCHDCPRKVRQKCRGGRNFSFRNWTPKIIPRIMNHSWNFWIMNLVELNWIDRCFVHEKLVEFFSKLPGFFFLKMWATDPLFKPRVGLTAFPHCKGNNDFSFGATETWLLEEKSNFSEGCWKNEKRWLFKLEKKHEKKHN